MSLHSFEPTQRGRGQPPKYPVKLLTIGESMFFPEVDVTRIGNAVRHHKSMKFICRSVVSRGVVGVRVWRVA